MLISRKYADLNYQLHQTRSDYGTSGRRWADLIRTLAGEVQAASVLDYGCGKQTLSDALPALNIRPYDPAIPGLDGAPEPADLVVCTDVLEHVEPECVEEVLDDLCRVTLKVAFITVATRPAAKTLADGRNAHLTVRPYAWWREHFLSRFDLIEVAQVEGFEFCLLLKALHADLPTLPPLLRQDQVEQVGPASATKVEVAANARVQALVHDGMRMLFHTPNAMTKWQVHSFHEKEPDTVRWLQQMPVGCTFLDVGANVGMYSIFAAVVRKARVFAFEPESLNFALLNQNIEANGLSGQVTGYPLALSNEIAMRPLYLSSMSQGGSHHSFGEKVGFDLNPRAAAFAQGSFAVTIDHLVESGAMPCPQFIKVDVDGFEHKVLEGARKTIANPTLQQILIELNKNLPEHRVAIDELTRRGFTHGPSQAGAGPADLGGLQVRWRVHLRAQRRTD